MTLDQLDITVFETIRRELVQFGYLPDVLLYPNNLSGYTAAKEAIRENGILIDLFGNGVADSRDKFYHNKIIIDRVKNDIGSIGGHGATFYEQQGIGAGSTFTKKAYADSTDDVNYDIRVIAANPVVESAALGILGAVFGRVGHIKVYGLDGEVTSDYVQSNYGGTVNVSAVTDYKETVSKYQFKDVWIMPDKVLLTNIKPLSSIEIDVYLRGTPIAGATPDLTLKFPNNE